ncbi:MAG: NADH-quinone oxidoreductase subunit NuoE [Rhodospirillaceae bacterium]|nr:NADH-quinone oxidoreductase subunit NuoE [Rhodospirillaceae bacterium]
MSFGHAAPREMQPDSFAFTKENLEKAQQVIAKYPPGRQQSAVMALLDLAQRQHDNWLPTVAMDYVADLLEMPRIRVYEVATFYTMYHLAPVGKWHLQVCTTTPCWLRGSDEVMRAIKDKTGLGGHSRHCHGAKRDEFTCEEVECLGACVNAPMLQVNDDYYEDLDYERTCQLIDALKAGKPPQVGSMTGRQGSQAQAGSTSLQHVRKQLEEAAKQRAAAKPADTAPAKAEGSAEQPAAKAKPKAKGADAPATGTSDPDDSPVKTKARANKTGEAQEKGKPADAPEDPNPADVPSHPPKSGD